MCCSLGAMLIATWNVNSLNARMERVLAWLADVQPDVLCMQETKMTDAAFPALEFNGVGYEAVHNGQGRWNGVAILSKLGLDDVVYGFDESIEPDPDSRIISAQCGDVRVHSVYVPNGRAVDHEHYEYKLDWLGRLRQHLDSTCSPEDKVVVAGDFNIIPDDIDVWDPKFFEGSTHVTPAERKALANVCEWGLTDTFRKRYPETEGLFSYYDYQAGRFHKKQGIRIDYLLATESLAKTCTLDIVDRNARKGTKPSDHAPVLAGYNA